MKKSIAKILSRKEVAQATYEVVFQCENEMFNFKPGQYVEITIPTLLNTRNNIRNFSIASLSNDQNTITILFRASDSDFKRELIELPMGGEVIINGPLGVFKLPETNDEDIILIAGGVGISPFMSMIRFVIEQQQKFSITLFYFNSTPERAVYVHELEVLAQLNPNFKLKLKYGNIDEAYIKDNVKTFVGKKWFVAGPSEMADTTRALLHELGVAERDIFIEEMTGYDVSSHNQIQQISNPQNKTKVRSEIDAAWGGDLSALSLAFLQGLSDSAIVSITDINGKIIYVNDLFVKISKYSREELIGQNHRILKSGYHSSAFYKNMWTALAKGDVAHGEIKNRAKDGSIYFVSFTIVPIFGDKGEIKNYLSVRFLITDRINVEVDLQKKTEVLEQVILRMKERELELENTRKATLNILKELDMEKKMVEKKVEERTMEIDQEKNKLLQVTKNMMGGAILLDNNGTVIFTNERFYDLFGVPQNNAQLSSVLSIIVNYFKQSDIEDYFKRFFAGETFNVPEIDGNGKIFEIFFHCLRDSNNSEKITGYFILLFDITNTKLLERSKSEIVAIASHQLRTPLTAMRGNIEMLADESFGILNKGQHELVEDIQISTTRLIGMVNDMLDITKIEQGKLDMVCEIINVNDLFHSIIDDLADYAKRHNFIISTNLQDTNTTVFGDKIRVRQVFQNLIDNAIKYGRDSGLLHISSCIEGDHVKFSFKDSGIGIPKQEQSSLFERFYRASNTANLASGGSGLGLYIVKSLVKELGGDIWFESEENVGTTFFVTIPRTK